MAVEMTIEYQGQLNCRAVHGPSKQCIVTDAPVDNGGKGEAFSPTDLVAAGLGSCILTILALVGKRSGIELQGARAQVTKEMTPAAPRRIALLKAVITMPAGIAEADRARLEAAARVCPVKQSLHPDVKVEIAFVYPK